MTGQHPAIRYAKALYEVAEENGNLPAVTRDMEFISNLLQEAPAIKDYCQAQQSRGSQEREFIETAFLPYISEFSANMLTVAVNNGRLPALPLIPQAFAKIREEKSGIITVLLETAHTPADDLFDIVRERMKKKTGKEIEIEHKLSPELMGGFRIWYEGRMIDSSVAGRLIRLKRLLETF